MTIDTLDANMHIYFNYLSCDLNSFMKESRALKKN